MLAFFNAHLPLAAMLVAGFFLWCYVVVASVEFGATLFLLFPKLSGGRTIPVAKLLSPVWEVNNVFLVGFFVSLIAFFPGFIPWFSTALFIPLCIFLVASGIRIFSVLIFFYSSFSRLQQSMVMRLIFTLSAFIAAGTAAWGATSVIVGVSPVLWLGQFLILEIPAVVLALSGLAAFAGVGIKLFSGVDARSMVPLGIFIDLSCVAFAFSAIVFFRVLPLFADHAAGSTDLLWLSIALAIALALVALGRLASRPSATFLGLAAMMGILIFYAISLQYPYLVYPFITAAGAFTAAATAPILFIVFCVGLLLVLPSLVLLYKLFL